MAEDTLRLGKNAVLVLQGLKTRRKIVCHVSGTLARLYNPDEHIGKDIKQIRRELAEKLQPKLNAVKAKYKLSESGAAGAKSLIELIKALDSNPSATPSTIPAGMLAY